MQNILSVLGWIILSLSPKSTSLQNQGKMLNFNLKNTESQKKLYFNNNIIIYNLDLSTDSQDSKITVE